MPRREDAIAPGRSNTPTSNHSEVLGDALVDALMRAGDGVFVTDPEGRIILWNPAAETMLGYSRDEVLLRPCCPLLAGVDEFGEQVCTPECAVSHRANGGDRIVSFDVRTRSRAGLPVWLNISLLMIRAGRIGAPFMVHLFRDVTFSKEELALAHEGEPVTGPPCPSGALTRREREVLRLMGGGRNTAAMAAHMHVSRATVRNHVQNILLKLNVHSRLEAVAHGLRHRLL